MISLHDAHKYKANTKYRGAAWEWPSVGLIFQQSTSTTRATVNGTIIWEKEGLLEPIEVWSEISSELLHHDVMCAPLKTTYEITINGPSANVAESPFDEWLQNEEPKTYTEQKRLALTRHYISVLRNEYADNKRKPNVAERDLLQKWLQSWDWTELDTTYGFFLTNTFAQIPTKYWIARISHDNPKFGLKLALYCAIRMDALNNPEDQPGLTPRQKTEINEWYEHAKMFAHPVLKNIRTQKTCYVDHVIESYLKAKVITRTEANTVKTIYRVHRELLGVDDQAPVLLKAMLGSMEPKSAQEHIHLPDNLVFEQDNMP